MTDDMQPPLVNRPKPSGWTEDEFILMCSDSGWHGPLDEFVDLIRRLGPSVEIERHYGTSIYIHFETIVLYISNRLDCEGLIYERVPGTTATPGTQHRLLFTHPDSLVNCRISPEENFRRNGKYIYWCRATARTGIPTISNSYSEDENFDMMQYDVKMDNFGREFGTLKLANPVVLNI